MKSKNSRIPNTVTLARALSKLGLCSRSQANVYIKEGKVRVNGKVVRDADRWCNLKLDRITLQSEGKEEHLKAKPFIYIAMNKPKDVVTTRSDEKGRKTVYDLLINIKEWVFPVGRLDKDTSGLLLFTNDTKFGDVLTNPDSKVPKTYLVRIDRPLEDNDAGLIRQGMVIEQHQLRPVRVKNIKSKEGEYWIEMIIVEGRNRQIRRMLELLDYSILDLIRTKIGEYSLEELPEGTWRYLTADEVGTIVKK